MSDQINKAILEGIELEKAEVVLASKGISTDIQDMIEKLSKMQNEDLPALKEGIEIAFGINEAEAYVSSVDQYLDSSIDTLKQTKTNIDSETAKLSGEEVASGMVDSMEPEMDLDVDAELDLDVDAEIGDDFGSVDSLAGPEDEPLGRARKESKENKKATLSEMSIKRLLVVKEKIDKLVESKQNLSKTEVGIRKSIMEELKKRKKKK